MIMDINQPFVTQEQKFKYWEESKAEIQTLRAKVASADLLLSELEVALRKVQTNLKRPIKTVHGSLIISFAFVDEALATYEKQNEVK